MSDVHPDPHAIESTHLRSDSEPDAGSGVFGTFEALRRRARRIDLVMPWIKPVLVGLILALLSWEPGASLVPSPGVASSWEAGLHMAAVQGLAHGTDFIQTYGPLGFLRFPTLWFTSTGVLAILDYLLLQAALCTAIFLSLRRWVGAVAAFVIALVAASVVHEPVPVIAFLWAAWALRQEWRTALIVSVAVAGIVSGLELLDKANTGVEVCVMTFATAALLPSRKRAIPVLVVGAFVGFLAGWLATGQPIGSIGDFVTYTRQIVSGYSTALGLDVPERAWEYGAALLVVAGIAAGIVETQRTSAGARRAPLLVVFALLAFFTFKEGFTRHDLNSAPFAHSTLFFGTMVGAACALAWRPGRRAVGVMLLGMAFVAFLGSLRGPIEDAVDPFVRLPEAGRALRAVIDESYRSQLEAEGHRAIKADARLDPATLAALRGFAVHAMPWNTAVVWAYGLRWAPLPDYQQYQAYTPALDQVNVRRLAGPRAPERILFQLVGADGRYEPYDGPATTRAMLCRYRPGVSRPPWLVLAHAPNRCGNVRYIGSVSAAWKHDVSVPAPSDPNALVFVRITGAGPAGLEALRTLVFKGNHRSITFDGRTTYQLVEATAPDGLPVRAGAGVDFPAPFSQVPQAQTISLNRANLGSTSGRPLRFSFYEQQMNAR